MRSRQPHFFALCCGALLLLPRLAAEAADRQLRFEPQILVLVWLDDRGREEIAATSKETCAAAVRAALAYPWPADRPGAVGSCSPGNRFLPGSDCIAGYSCPRPSKSKTRGR